MERTSKCSCLTATEGNGTAEIVAEAPRSRAIMLIVYILVGFLKDGWPKD